MLLCLHNICCIVQHHVLGGHVQTTRIEGVHCGVMNVAQFYLVCASVRAKPHIVGIAISRRKFLEVGGVTDVPQRAAALLPQLQLAHFSQAIWMVLEADDVSQYGHGEKSNKQQVRFRGHRGAPG